jgi:hypothetical protein
LDTREEVKAHRADKVTHYENGQTLRPTGIDEKERTATQAQKAEENIHFKSMDSKSSRKQTDENTHATQAEKSDATGTITKEDAGKTLSTEIPMEPPGGESTSTNIPMAAGAGKL